MVQATGLSAMSSPIAERINVAGEPKVGSPIQNGLKGIPNHVVVKGDLSNHNKVHGENKLSGSETKHHSSSNSVHKSSSHSKHKDAKDKHHSKHREHSKADGDQVKPKEHSHHEDTTKTDLIPSKTKDISHKVANHTGHKKDTKPKDGEKVKKEGDRVKEDGEKTKKEGEREKDEKTKVNTEVKIGSPKEKTKDSSQKLHISKDKIKEKHKHSSSDHKHGLGEHKHSSGEHKHSSGEHKHSSGEHKHSSGEHKHSSGEHKHSSGEHKHSSGEHKHSSREHKHGSSEHKHSLDKVKEKSEQKPKVVTEQQTEGKQGKQVHILKLKIAKVQPDSESKDWKKEVTVKPESKENNTKLNNTITNVKKEPLSDDDIPLAERASVKGTSKQQSSGIKRERDDTDEEPLSVRAEKAKKIKVEANVKKKRKLDEDFEPQKKVKKDNPHKKVKEESSTEGSPKKRGKQKAEEEDVWKWWEEEKLDSGVKWKTLGHQGPVFATPYERLPKEVHFYYDGKKMELSELTEEVAGFYARMLDHDYCTKKVFNDNFFKDWRKVMTAGEKETITNLGKCNFSYINEYYKQKSEERKNMTKEEKLAIKKQNEDLQQEYGYCIIDGHRQKIGNFKIEPPGLFRGRGEHPKMGMLKKRVQPEHVIINIGKESQVPKPPDGHKWKEVRHDNTVTWLASWTENILGQTKYIMLNPSSKLKGEKDWQKYETARKLKSCVDRIRQGYRTDWKSKEMKVRQRAVALYFIDKLALRAGNEKEEGETADTVGCCSLRVEHITLDEQKDGQQYVVSFDFLGKDSIRYYNTVPVEKRVFKNLKLFMENKQPGDDLFDRLNTAILNKYLNDLMEGLTAKVFRTYNASKTLQEQLELLTKDGVSLPEKLLTYNRANRAVAVLCNHQRTVPKTFSKQMENLQKKIDEKLEQIRECKKELKRAKQDYKNSHSEKDKNQYEKRKKQVQRLEDQLKKLEVQATDKEENKQIALGTSKLNYLDPRISVAWCKKWEVPIEKIYNRTQRDKFRWAIEMAGPDFKF